MAWDYVQTNDPGAVGAGKSWLHPATGDVKYRNTTNTQWNNGGNIDIPNLGLIPSVTGFAAADAHDFLSSVKKAGVELATSADVAAVESSLMTIMGDKIAEAISSNFNSLRVSDWVAAKTSFVEVAAGHGDKVNISLAKPVYGNGKLAADGDCTSMIAFSKIVWADGNLSSTWSLTKKTETTYELRIHAGEGLTLDWAATIVGIVVAVRK